MTWCRIEAATGANFQFKLSRRNKSMRRLNSRAAANPQKCSVSERQPCNAEGVHTCNDEVVIYCKVKPGKGLHCPKGRKRGGGLGKVLRRNRLNTIITGE